MRNLLVILSIFLLVFNTNAQTEGLELKTINGKEFYQYKVKKGNTLYSLSRTFGIDLDDLTKANPGIEKGLSIGQIINIPKEGMNQEKPTQLPGPKTVVPTDTNYIYHTTQQGETLYSIAKFYGIKPKALIEVNKKFEHNLPLNSVVKVPKKSAKSVASDKIKPIEKTPEHPSALLNDSLVLHKVAKGETLYSLSKKYGVSQEKLILFNPSLKNGLKKGDKLTIPVPKKIKVSDEFIETVEQNNITITPVDGAINIAVFAPFMFDEYKKQREKCVTKNCPVFRPTLLSLNYYHGVQMALDSLKILGVNANVYVYDTKKDSSVVRKILLKKEFENMQLIFAPFFEHTVAPVYHYAKVNNVLVVNAVPQKTNVLKDNPNVSNTLASTNVQLKFLGNYVAKNHSSDNLIVLKNNEARDNYYALFQDAFKTHSVNNDSVTQTYMNRNLTALKGKLKKDQTNVIVVPSKDVRYVSEFLTKLNASINQRAYHDYKIKVYGLGDWLSFNNIDVNYLSRFNTSFTKASYVDYSSDNMQFLSHSFRKKYNYDPNKYVLTSFEAVLFHAYLIAVSGDQFRSNYNSTSFSGTHINYNFKQHGSNGFENQSVVIIGFENNKLQKLD